MRSPTVPSRRAFTLIELLVVISILAILMGLLFPAVQGALDSARKTQAKNDATQIASAIQAYATEYGKMPPPADGQDTDAEGTNSAALWTALSPSGSGSTAATDNPRGLVFLEIPTAKGGKNGIPKGGAQYMDPWGHAYRIVLDGNYDNQVKGPDDTVQKTVIVWSFGKDGKQDSATPSSSGKKADDVHSWE